MKWEKAGKDTWTADVGEAVPARIKQMDVKWFSVYRNGRYLGVEGDLETAQKRADLNMRSEINREMDWQREHRDEQPLGLRLTPEERAVRDTPSAPRPTKRGTVRVPTGDLSAVLAAIPDKKPPKAKAEPLTPVEPTSKVIRDAARRPQKGSRDAELLTMLQRGCTTEEVLRVTGWQAISMPQLAKRLGVGLHIDKSGKPFKYSTKEK